MEINLKKPAVENSVHTNNLTSVKNAPLKGHEKQTKLSRTVEESCDKQNEEVT
jgi:hypothetical protein